MKITLLLSCLFICLCAHADSKPPYAFALLGDMPYGLKPNKPNTELSNTVKQINADKDIQWVLHVGDIKSGASRCSDEMYLDRLRRFNEFESAFILTPGDNEWTDCHRFLAGSYDPMERLTKLRNIFFSTPDLTQGKHPRKVASQAALHPKYPLMKENLMWAEGGVTYATIHITGSKNGRNKFDKLGRVKRTKKHDAEIRYREAAALAWLQTAFDYAKENKSRAILIATQANPGLEKDPEMRNKKHFIPFLTLLEKQAREFNNPVVLAHGDSHYFRIDRPRLMKRHPPKNFLRVESFGDTNEDWIKVYVDTQTPHVFTFAPMNSSQ
ncbi:metallophosphoesterase [Teredinibacter sp. KSP-S5-2]|uniref:metallophosphoesterase n=1 Tax=Teredinibacter sp. KSP-S5-2 TaxID=3034506 RepID=UPI0029344DB5|nr:metallophosphoesterase [Teredinibacter sp. KSP-S5-2]WNO09551.1 hypothetical protein P5V12_21680 [Teredinibacter sp. KSP-S5-2]